MDDQRRDTTKIVYVCVHGHLDDSTLACEFAFIRMKESTDSKWTLQSFVFVLFLFVSWGCVWWFKMDARRKTQDDARVLAAGGRGACKWRQHKRFLARPKHVSGIARWLHSQSSAQEWGNIAGVFVNKPSRNLHKCGKYQQHDCRVSDETLPM